MAEGTSAIDQSYEVRYGWHRADLFLLPLTVGFTLLGGGIVLGNIMNPAIPLWRALIPLAPHLMLLVGPYLLVLRLGLLVEARIALRIDSYGLLVERPWPLWRNLFRVGWHDVTAIELFRATRSGLPIRPGRIRVWWSTGQARAVPQGYQVGGLRLDRNRMLVAIRHHAPHVRIVDRW